MYCCFFFFKQKTAYEMRISDWSSDVCSSDLDALLRRFAAPRRRRRRAEVHRLAADRRLGAAGQARQVGEGDHHRADHREEHAEVEAHRRRQLELLQEGQLHVTVVAGQEGPPGEPGARSEEHTSELQSLMRNSYAVFCFKK